MQLHILTVFFSLLYIISGYPVWNLQNQKQHTCGHPGIALPDLIVDPQTLVKDLKVTTETFSAESCDSREGGFPAGTYRLLRFSVTTPNIGDSDLYIGDPCQYWEENSDSAGLFEYAPCHDHFHFKRYSKYELIPLNNPKEPIYGHKQGYCMMDSVHYAGISPKNYHVCGKPGKTPDGKVTCSGPGFIRGEQGISVGWGDSYPYMLQGQYIIINGLSGFYRLLITVNPPFEAINGKCPDYSVMSNNKCYQVCEKNYSNNQAYVDLKL